jgi:hypothetical protein
MDAAIEKFLDAGLIEPVGEPVAPAVGAEVATPVPRSPARPAAADRAAPAGAAIVGDWRRIQSRATDLLREVMGADADLLAMRLERARTEQEFLSHLERSFQVVDTARGADALAQYRANLIAR